MNQDILCVQSIDQNFGKLVVECLDTLRISSEIFRKTQAVQVLADTAKCDLGRNACLQNGNVIQTVKSVFSENETSIEFAIQVCRLMGNMCYECHEGRVAVLQSGILGLFSVFCPCLKYTLFLCRFLFNFCVDNVTSLEAISKHKLINVVISNLLQIENILPKPFSSEIAEVFMAVISLFDVVVDRNQLKLLAEAGPALDYCLRDCDQDIDVIISALGLLKHLVDDRDSVLLFARCNLCSTIAEQVSKRWRYKGELYDQVVRDACDVLVLCMQYETVVQYVHDQGVLPTLVRGWIALLDDEDVIETGRYIAISSILIMGNVACEKDRALTLLNQDFFEFGLQVKFLNKSVISGNKDILLAILGCWRNLAVNTTVAIAVLPLGIFDSCLKTATFIYGRDANEYQRVIFKLLATIRLLLGATANTEQKYSLSVHVMKVLGGQIIKHWSQIQPDMTGVTVECKRLLAVIFDSFEVALDSVVPSEILSIYDVINLISSLLSTKHPKLVHEAITALKFLLSRSNKLEFSEKVTKSVIDGLEDVQNNALKWNPCDQMKLAYDLFNMSQLIDPSMCNVHKLLIDMSGTFTEISKT